jgi:hypothetical protein
VSEASLVAEVQRRALSAAARGKVPTELGELRAMSIRIARDLAIDEWRKREARSRYDLGPAGFRGRRARRQDA